MFLCQRFHGGYRHSRADTLFVSGKDAHEGQPENQRMQNARRLGKQKKERRHPDEEEYPLDAAVSRTCPDHKSGNPAAPANTASSCRI